MFKKNQQKRRPWQIAALVLLFTALLAGCGTVQRFPPVNLSEKGWTSRHGQAVWHVNASTEIAGDLMVATNTNGQAYLDFTKSPVTLVIAQSTSNAWQAEFVPQGRVYSGKGKPPARLLWLQLPNCLLGSLPPKPWSWQRLGDNS